MGDEVTFTIDSKYVNAAFIVSRKRHNSGSHTLKRAVRGMAEANVILVLALILYMGIASLLRTSWRVTDAHLLNTTFDYRCSRYDVVYAGIHRRHMLSTWRGAASILDYEEPCIRMPSGTAPRNSVKLSAVDAHKH